MTPQTLLDALKLYTQTEPCLDNPRLISNLRTTLKRYVLPGVTQKTKLRFEKNENFERHIQKTSLEVFLQVNPKDIFFESSKQAVETKQVTERTIDNYRSALFRFLAWMQSQVWYEELVGTRSETRAPRLRYNGANLCASRKGKRAHSKNAYGIRKAEIPPRIAEQLKQFEKFCTAPKISKRQDGPIRQETLKAHTRHILAFLGWFKNIEGWNSDDLSLELLVDKDFLDEYISWAISEKGNSYNWARLVGCASLLIAKWLHHRRSGKAMYRDIDEIEALRSYIRELNLSKKVEPSRLGLEEKYLTFEQCQEIVKYLRKCCAPRNGKYVKRTDSAIVKSWQKYLLIAIFTYCPVRQRELRELELGRTLFREPDGYVVRLKPDDHKTGSKTGKGREYRLPPNLTADLDEWLNVWRPKMSKEHNFVFIKVGSTRHPMGQGEPISTRGIHSMVTTTVYHVTQGLFGEGKRTSPQFFRNIAITYQRNLPNQTLEEREGLAEIMGHSVATADKTYSLMTSAEKTAKSVEWWKPKT